MKILLRFMSSRLQSVHCPGLFSSVSNSTEALRFYRPKGGTVYEEVATIRLMRLGISQQAWPRTDTAGLTMSEPASIVGRIAQRVRD